MERGDSQQGSSSEGAMYSTVPSVRALSQVRVGPSDRQVGEEEIDSEEIKVVYSEEDLDTVELEVT